MALGATLISGGCSLSPDYRPPSVAVAPAFKELPAGWTTANPGADLGGAWWEAFGDPILDALEPRVWSDNQTMAASVARYDAALGAVTGTRSALFPQVGAGGGAERSRVSANRPLSATGQPVTQNDYRLGASMTWEIDFFGRIRNSVKAARADAAASASDVATVRLALQAQLASAYFQMRGLDARQALLRETVAAYERAYDLTDTRHDGGVASGLDASRAQEQLKTAQAELAGIPADRAALEHAIAILVGENPSTFAIAPHAFLPVPPPFSSGTPSTLLQRRPDIDAAERRVFAANARIGAAKAAFFPTIALGATGGYETTGPNLLSAASSFWALGPAAFALPLFDGGRRTSQLRIARADFAEAAASYRQTVLVAFQEVEDDIAANRGLTVQIATMRDAVSAADKTRDLALTRYRDGASDYLDVVTAQTAALDSARALLQLETRQLTTTVDLVRALGGPIDG